jgi:hypothetical protein
MAIDLAKPTDPFSDVRNALAPYKPEQYHRLVPTALQERSPLYRPAVAVVKINASDTRDVYPTPGAKDGTLCLHTQALERLGNAAGIDFLRTEYEGDPKEPYLVTAHVFFEVIDALGQRRRGHASATCDYREGTIASKLLGGGLSVARQFIRERTEARARNRAIRKWNGMATSFTREELEKPFVAVRWRLDESDPDVKRALIAQGVGASDQIFGQPRALPEALEKRVDDILDAGHAEPEGVVDGSLRELGRRRQACGRRRPRHARGDRPRRPRD